MGRGLLLTSNLPQLQNLIKRDPVAYKEEFLQQWNHYNSIRQIFKINPDEQAQHYRELVTFISQVGSSQPSRTMLTLLFVGSDMLSEGNCRISFAHLLPSTGKLWGPLSRYS
jgi:hypothetical protein